jgi:putative acetyltransferase
MFGEMTSPEKITVRRAEPDDYEALHKIFSGRQAFEGTLQLPLPSVEQWRKRLSEPTEATHQLVACVAGEVAGELTLWTYPAVWRRRHVGRIGMAVRDDWQGKGIGTALMEAAVDLADNWLGLTRIELEVYTDNRAGIALYEKFGFEIEGTHRRFAFRAGEHVDAYSMARLR